MHPFLSMKFNVLNLPPKNTFHPTVHAALGLSPYEESRVAIL